MKQHYIRNRLAQLPPEQKIQSCTAMLCAQINRNDRYAAAEINDYVRRIVAGMTEDELAAMETAIPTYAAKIQEKIRGLEEAYREDKFGRWLDAGKIVCQASYTLPPVITPADTTDAIPKSLYEAEKDDMNNGEHELIDAVVALGNVKWWHRIIERKGFRLNGYINHYPDFIVYSHKIGGVTRVSMPQKPLTRLPSRFVMWLSCSMPNSSACFFKVMLTVRTASGL